MKVEEGKDFIATIKNELKGSHIVICLITPAYYESHFCIAELGAVWALGQNFFPILVPPHDYQDLTSVLQNTQVAKLDDKGALTRLYDRIVKLGIGKNKTDRWEVKRNAFLARLPRLLRKLQQPTKVSMTEHVSIMNKFDEANRLIAESDELNDQLRNKVDDLEACKDAKQVKAIKAKYNTPNTEYQELLSDAKAKLQNLPSPVQEALYHYMRGEDWVARSGFDRTDDWDAINDAVTRGLVEVNGNSVTPIESHPKVKRAIESLYELKTFMEEPPAGL
jgi:hypothetical protein